MAHNQYQISEMAWNHYLHSRNAYGALSRRDEAALFAQCVQLGFLQNPTSAKFPQPQQMQVSDIGNGRFCVRGYVDTLSPYGVMTRIDYTHFVQQDSAYRWHYAPLTPDMNGKDAAQIAGAFAASVAIPIILTVLFFIIFFVLLFIWFPFI